MVIWAGSYLPYARQTRYTVSFQQRVNLLKFLLHACFTRVVGLISCSLHLLHAPNGQLSEKVYLVEESENGRDFSLLVFKLISYCVSQLQMVWHCGFFSNG